MKLTKGLAFDDVLLVPQYSDIESRKEVDIGNQLDSDIDLSLPILSAPMDKVTESAMVNAMAEMGGLGVIHRYNTIEEQLEIVKKASVCSHRACAIPATGDFLERAKALVTEGGVRVLCVDIAHAHHIHMKNALDALKTYFGDNIHLMAGNVATLKAFNDLSDWGADSIKVGIGGGSICSTRILTGHGMPTLQSVYECSKSDRNAVLIADGGIKTSGDMVKALGFGADLVMVGSLLSGTSQAPGDIHYNGNGEPYKQYRGMASKEAQNDWRGRSASIEGVAHYVPYKGCVKKILKDLDNGIRSGLSYSGARSINELQATMKVIEQTSAGQFESSTHIKSK
tara:strand:+ start:51 stop:1070 length:1020 start_codon:yes stop_codon:yes gene_type:complete